MGIEKHPFPGVHMVEFQLAKGKMKVLMLAKAKEDGSVDPRFRYRLMSIKKLSSNAISKRANTNKVRHPELVLCVLV